MDYPAFLDQLRRLTHLEWVYLDISVPAIRAFDQGVSFCPITAVHRKLTCKTYNNGSVYAAGERIGLTPELVTQIMNAADGWTGHDETIRRELLQAVGLLEDRA